MTPALGPNGAGCPGKLVSFDFIHSTGHDHITNWLYVVYYWTTFAEAYFLGFLWSEMHDKILNFNNIHKFRDFF